jgi:hypothetical protein
MPRCDICKKNETEDEYQSFAAQRENGVYLIFAMSFSAFVCPACVKKKKDSTRMELFWRFLSVAIIIGVTVALYRAGINWLLVTLSTLPALYIIKKSVILFLDFASYKDPLNVGDDVVGDYFKGTLLGPAFNRFLNRAYYCYLQENCRDRVVVCNEEGKRELEERQGSHDNSSH